MIVVNRILVLVCLCSVNAGRWISFEPGVGPIKAVPGSLVRNPAVRGSAVNDINKVVRSQMGMVASEYNNQKIARGNVYDSLKDKTFLKALKANLKNDFRKTVTATGRDSRTKTQS